MFEPGTKGTVKSTISQGSYVASDSATYSPGKHVASVPTHISDGSYVSAGSGTYSRGIHIELPVVRLALPLTGMPTTAIYSPGVSCVFQSIPQYAGDNTIHIGYGQKIDFIATPRYGTEPLGVQFTNLSSGSITEYYWTFGDGRRSFHSDPVHVYSRGIYDVFLRIKIGIRTLTLRKRNYIIALQGGLVVSRTTRCIRQAILPEQGIGFYEMPASAMAMPEAGVGAITIYDANNQIRGLVLDAKTGKWYDTTTRDGPTGTGITKVWTGIDGAEFNRSMKFKEDRGTDEKDFQRLLETHLYMRPFAESNRNKTGYDANGYPTGLEVDLEFFNDGELTAAATIEDIPLNGDLKTDKKVSGNRIQMGVNTNRGAHIILNRLNIYDSSRRAAAPDNRVMTEQAYQEELATLIFWASVCDGAFINRVTGNVIALGTAVLAAGPENNGVNSAVSFSAALALGTTIIDAGSIMFWLEGTASLTIGGVAVSMTTLGTANGFSLKYASGITGTGAVVLTPTGTAKVADVRMSGSALSAGAKSYYLADVEDNSGKIVIP